MLIRRLAAVAALAVVLLLDTVAAARPWPLVVIGLLDEPAHFLTAWLLLTALLPDRSRALLPWALVAVVLIDVDHLPLFLWGVGAVAEFGRPVTHSLALAAALLVLSWTGGRVRTPLRGLALGVLLHLVRDLATGPGVPLLWPLDDSSVLAPYPAYVALLCLVTAVAVLRAGRSRVAAEVRTP